MPHSLLQRCWVPSSPPKAGLCRLLLQRSVIVDHMCSTHLQSLGLVPESRVDLGMRLHIGGHIWAGAWDGKGMSCDRRPIAYRLPTDSDGFKGRLRSVLFLTHRSCNLQQNQVSEISYCMMPLPWGTLALNHACNFVMLSTRVELVFTH